MAVEERRDPMGVGLRRDSPAAREPRQTMGPHRATRTERGQDGRLSPKQAYWSRRQAARGFGAIRLECS